MAHFIRRTIILLFILGVIGLVVAQFTNPPRGNPKVDPSQTVEAQLHPPKDVITVFERACRDCHTDTTDWPWYSSIAPGSWLMIADVYVARRHMNLSEWGKQPPAEQYELLGNICKFVTDGEMPLWYYQYLHWPSAYLSKDEVNRICSWTKTAQAQLRQQHPDLKEEPREERENKIESKYPLNRFR